MSATPLQQAVARFLAAHDSACAAFNRKLTDSETEVLGGVRSALLAELSGEHGAAQDRADFDLAGLGAVLAPTAAEVTIRAALAAGPTPGRWWAQSRGTYWHEEEADVRAADGAEVDQAEFVHPIGDVPTTRGQMYMRDAAFIVACDPVAMAELLSHLDALRALYAAKRGARKRASESGPLCANPATNPNSHQS
ncbi:hypothetical protein ACSFA0_22610 [Variovorax sp. LT1P1]|uniref:hypothetical protein n=1 Tax=Variovorax sp. LT1P1 TaxID=3443730 RepID=UPI003F45A3DF